jgi:hypothetical protein
MFRSYERRDLSLEVAAGFYTYPTPRLFASGICHPVCLLQGEAASHFSSGDVKSCTEGSSLMQTPTCTCVMSQAPHFLAEVKLNCAGNDVRRMAGL